MKNFKLSKNIGTMTPSDIDLFQKLNLGIEIQAFSLDVLNGDYEDLVLKFKDLLANFDYPISLHGSSFDLNPGSTDPLILDVTRFRYLQSIEIATQLNAQYVIFHSQIEPLLTVEHIRKLKLDNQVQFWKSLLPQIGDITILLENEYDKNYDELLYIIEQVNSPKLKVCLDTGHALAYSDLCLSDWLAGLGNHIKYVHLHWNDGKSDSHTLPTNEQFKYFKNLLLQFNLNPIITLECRIVNLEEQITEFKSLLL